MGVSHVDVGTKIPRNEIERNWVGQHNIDFMTNFSDCRVGAWRVFQVFLTAGYSCISQFRDRENPPCIAFQNGGLSSLTNRLAYENPAVRNIQKTRHAPTLQSLRPGNVGYLSSVVIRNDLQNRFTDAGQNLNSVGYLSSVVIRNDLQNRLGVALLQQETTGKRDKKGKMRNGRCVQTAEHFLFLSIFLVVFAVTKEPHPNRFTSCPTF